MNIPILLDESASADECLEWSKLWVYNSLYPLLDLDKPLIIEDNYSIEHYKGHIQLGENIHVYLLNNCFSNLTSDLVDSISKEKKEDVKGSTTFRTLQLKLSGSGCREIERRCWGGLLYFMKEMSKKHFAKCSRLDIAIDDFNCKHAKWNLVCNCFEKGLYISPFHNVHRNGNEKNGFSWYLGTRGCNQLCIYDKKKEQETVHLNNVQVDNWIRYEMRFLSKGQACFEYIVNSLDINLPRFSKQLLKGLLIFISKNNYSSRNKYKNSICQWWDRFLGNVSSIKLENQAKIESTITSGRVWFNNKLNKFVAIQSALSPYDFLENLTENIINSYADVREDKKAMAKLDNHCMSNAEKHFSDYDLDRAIEEMSELNNFIKQLKNNPF